MNIYLETGFWPIFLYPKGINITYQNISIPMHLGFCSVHICERSKYLHGAFENSLSKAHLWLEAIIGISIQS